MDTKLDRRGHNQSIFDLGFVAFEQHSIEGPGGFKRGFNRFRGEGIGFTILESQEGRDEIFDLGFVAFEQHSIEGPREFKRGFNRFRGEGIRFTIMGSWEEKFNSGHPLGFNWVIRGPAARTGEVGPFVPHCQLMATSTRRPPCRRFR
ncbi:hypothetical protein CRG98_000083 [Punica granatum]|uniref:Uncharacterized protein n=1 Tax=Punica granatum TaxID=22663 RepID=A0A2I0LFR5_PUNGR|nr:hypothetical protein CRG98_000083 [Punica granatum]